MSKTDRCKRLYLHTFLTAYKHQFCCLVNNSLIYFVLYILMASFMHDPHYPCDHPLHLHLHIFTSTSPALASRLQSDPANLQTYSVLHSAAQLQTYCQHQAYSQFSVANLLPTYSFCKVWIQLSTYCQHILNSVDSASLHTHTPLPFVTMSPLCVKVNTKTMEPNNRLQMHIPQFSHSGWF